MVSETSVLFRNYHQHCITLHKLFLTLGSPGGSDGKESACNAGYWVQSLDQEDPLEKGMATHSSVLAWRILWTEEFGGLQSMGCRVGHD